MIHVKVAEGKWPWCPPLPEPDGSGSGALGTNLRISLTDVAAGVGTGLPGASELSSDVRREGSELDFSVAASEVKDSELASIVVEAAAVEFSELGVVSRTPVLELVASDDENPIVVSLINSSLVARDSLRISVVTSVADETSAKGVELVGAAVATPTNKRTP